MENIETLQSLEDTTTSIQQLITQYDELKGGQCETEARDFLIFVDRMLSLLNRQVNWVNGGIQEFQKQCVSQEQLSKQIGVAMKLYLQESSDDYTQSLIEKYKD